MNLYESIRNFDKLDMSNIEVRTLLNEIKDRTGKDYSIKGHEADFGTFKVKITLTDEGLEYYIINSQGDNSASKPISDWSLLDKIFESEEDNCPIVKDEDKELYNEITTKGTETYTSQDGKIQDYNYNGKDYRLTLDDNMNVTISIKECEIKETEDTEPEEDFATKVYKDFQTFLDDHNIKEPTEDDINDYFTGFFYDIETEEDLDDSNKAEELIRAKYLGECNSKEIKEANTNSLYITTEELIAYANQFLSSIGCKAIISPDKKIMVEVPVDKTDAWMKLHDQLSK